MLLPVSATLFARVGVAGLVLNFVAIPAMVAVQLAGTLAVLLSTWWLAAARLAALIGELGVWAITSSARVVDVLPWLSWRVAPPAVAWVLAYYVAVGTLALTTRTRVKAAAAIAAVVGLACVLTSPDLSRAGPPAHVLRVTMMDVGQGEATLLQFPGGRSLLVDSAAASPAFDAGERVVAPALWALGVRRLDWLAITHPDLDHDGGALAVATALNVREVWEGVPVQSDPERSALRRQMHERGGSWRQLRSGDRLEVGGVDIQVLHPDLPDWERQRPRNDDSLVLRVTYGRTEFLLPGDVTAAIESGLPLDAGLASLRVLKLAHHGSRSSTTAGLLGTYKPVLALASAGQGNLFGHPAVAVLRRLENAQVRVFRTDRDHAITIESDGAGLRVWTWAGDSWQAGAWASSASMPSLRARVAMENSTSPISSWSAAGLSDAATRSSRTSSSILSRTPSTCGQSKPTVAARVPILLARVSAGKPRGRPDRRRVFRPARVRSRALTRSHCSLTCPAVSSLRRRRSAARSGTPRRSKT
jgi:competence protein ComEC